MLVRIALALVLALGAAAGFAQAPKVTAELPVLVTSSGQSLDGFTVKTLLGRAGVANEYNALAKPGDLGAAKTLVIAFGASVKGFGSAGVTADSEMARTKALLAAAQERKMKVIGVHIDDRFVRNGLLDTAAMKPLARCGYHNYAVVERQFRMVRPTKA